MSAAERPATIHASAVVVGGHGVLIRGASGSGKSALAMALIEDPRGDAVLVGDDRIHLHRKADALEARPAPALAGLIELRGVGILRRPHCGRAVIRLVVDLLPEAECPRLPDGHERIADVDGFTLARLCLPIGAPDGALRTRIALQEWVK